MPSVKRPLNFQRIKIFRVIYEVGSIRQAARRLGLSQPTVSRHIAVLEDELGFALFAREKGRTEPTWEAQRFYSETTGLIEGMERVENNVEAIRVGEGEALRIMSATSVAFELLPKALEIWRRKVPRTEVTVDSGRAIEQIRAIRSGIIDVGLAGSVQPQAGLRITTLQEEKLVAIMPSTHPLASKEFVDLEDFAVYPSVLLSPHAPIGHTVMQAFERANVTPNKIMTSFAPSFAIGLVKALQCISIVDSLVYRALANEHVTARPVSTKLCFDMVFIENENSPPRRIVEAFKDAMKEAIGSDNEK